MALVTFKAGDVADLERMLRQLIADPEARRQAGEHAQQRVRISLAPCWALPVYGVAALPSPTS